MEYVNLSPEAITAIAREVASFLDVDKQIEQKQRERILKRKHVTPYLMAKHKLVNGVKSSQTIIRMIKNGDFGQENQGWFYGKRGNYQVLTYVIRRYNGE